MRTDGRMRGVSAAAVVTDIYFVYAYACMVFWELLAGYRISVWSGYTLYVILMISHTVSMLELCRIKY